MIFFVACDTHKSYAYGDNKSIVIGYELDGVYIVRATGRATKKDMMSIERTQAILQAKKRAVYDMTFSILTSANIAEKSIKPIVLEVNAKDKYAEYFNVFFSDNGDWKNYAEVAGTRYAGTHFYKTSNERICTMAVKVNREALRKKLKEDKIIK